MEKEGFAGYGRWMRLLEIVAMKIGETDNCSVEYSVKKWCSLLGLKQKKLLSFLKQTENKLKTKVVCYDNIIRISIPNLLNKRDNHTKHLQVPYKSLVSKNKSKNIDKDKDIHIVAKKKVNGKGLYPELFDKLWEAYPSKDGKRDALKHFKATVRNDVDCNNIEIALDNYINHLKSNDWKRPKNGSTWFNGWQDWVEWIEPPTATKPSMFQAIKDW